MNDRIAVMGGGAWGTALANLASCDEREVDIYMREDDAVLCINSQHENAIFLPGCRLSKLVRAHNMTEFDKCEAGNIIWSVPTQFSRSVAKMYKSTLEGRNILNSSKGIEITSGKPVVQVLREEFSGQFSVLSGPSFARETALGKPTAVSLASDNADTAIWWQSMMSGNSFRIYTSNDMAGIEIGGALKNVIAIAVGISDGLGFGDNARAALITRSLIEMTRFGLAHGAKRETFMGLAGLGDLVLTSTGDSSRNRQTGLKLAQGLSIDDLSKGAKTVSEGVGTAKAVYEISEKLNIRMPICSEVYRIIYENKKPFDSVMDLMNRPLTHEDNI